MGFYSIIYTLYIYIYIYIYIVIHRQTVLNVARHVRCFKLELKPGWLYVSWISYSKAIVPLSVSEAIFLHISLYIRLSATGELNSSKELSIYTYVVAGNSPLTCSTHRVGSIHIVLSSRLFCCITTFQCGYTREMLQAGIETWQTLHPPNILP